MTEDGSLGLTVVFGPLSDGKTLGSWILIVEVQDPSRFLYHRGGLSFVKMTAYAQGESRLSVCSSSGRGPHVHVIRNPNPCEKKGFSCLGLVPTDRRWIRALPLKHGTVDPRTEGDLGLASKTSNYIAPQALRREKLSRGT